MLDRAAFLAERQTGIGASDAAGVLGLSRWATPLSVYQSKVEPLDDEASGMSLPQWLGLRLEDVVAELFTGRTGLETRADQRLHRHPEDPWLISHLDFRVKGRPDELVECKTAYDSRGWGDEGSEDVPVDYWVQAQHEMLVTGAKVCHLAALFSFRDFRAYRIERNDVFLGQWRQAAAEFWHDHVEAKVPPPLEGDQFSKQVVRARWPSHDEDLKVLPPERELVVLRLREERAKLKQQEIVVATLEHRVEDLIGDAAGITGTWGKVTWKTTKDRVKVAWQQVAEMLAAAIGDVIDNVNPGDDEQAVRSLSMAQQARDTAVSIYTSTEPGYRRIDVRFKDDGG